MLEDLSRSVHRQIVYRLVGDSELSAFARSLGLDSEQVRETLSFMGQSDRDDLLNGPFTPKPQLFAPHGFPKGRYSDGTWAVFYSASERATALAEVRYHSQVKFATAAGDALVQFSALECTFAGQAIDIRGKKDEWPDLVSSTTINSFCHGLAREGRGLADAFLAPSARAGDGTTLPIFKRPSLSQARTAGHVTFRYDYATRTLQLVQEGQE